MYNVPQTVTAALQRLLVLPVLHSIVFSMVPALHVHQTATLVPPQPYVDHVYLPMWFVMMVSATQVA